MCSDRCWWVRWETHLAMRLQVLPNLSPQQPVLGINDPALSSVNASVTFVSWNCGYLSDKVTFFKSTFCLFHFVCVCAHMGLQKVLSVKEHLLLFLPQGQVFIVRASSWVTAKACRIFPYMEPQTELTTRCFVCSIYLQCPGLCCGHTCAPDTRHPTQRTDTEHVNTRSACD